MKKYLFVTIFLALFSLAYAEKNVYFSNDGLSMGVIEFDSSDGTYIVMLQNNAPFYAGSYLSTSMIYSFDSAVAAQEYYRKEISQIEEDNYESFMKRFEAVRDSDAFLNVAYRKFTQGRTTFFVKTIPYSEKERLESIEAKNTDENYTTIKISELQGNKEKYDGQKVCILNIKLIGEDPCDRDGNIPHVVGGNDDGVLLVKIRPEAASVYRENKYKSLNYYGQFVKASEYDFYILVDKITVN